MTQNINRVDHVIYMCRPENHQATVDKLSALLNIQFEADDGGPAFGLRFTWSWSSGLEVISPAGTEFPFSKMCWEFLEQRGEGLFGVVIGVADVDAARARAVALGYSPGPIHQLHRDLKAARDAALARGQHVPESPWLNRVQDCTECKLDTFLGGGLAVGRVITDEGDRAPRA